MIYLVNAWRLVESYDCSSQGSESLRYARLKIATNVTYNDIPLISKKFVSVTSGIMLLVSEGKVSGTSIKPNKISHTCAIMKSNEGD